MKFILLLSAVLAQTCGFLVQKSCTTTSQGPCCSKFGYCGSTAAYCSQCQVEYSLNQKCQEQEMEPIVGLPCGKRSAGLKACERGCCSQFGYCGFDIGFCGTGCQVGYGQCGLGVTVGSATLIGTTTASVRTSNTGSITESASGTAQEVTVTTDFPTSTAATATLTTTLTESTSPELTASQSVTATEIESTTSFATPTTTTTCADVLIDDFADPQRYLLLRTNLLFRPTSDDNTCTASLSYNQNRINLVPKPNGYFYTQARCALDTTGFDGIAFRFQGGSMLITVRYYTGAGCTGSIINTSFRIPEATIPTLVRITKAQLLERGVNWGSLHGVLFSSFTTPITIYPIRFYCSGSMFIDPVPPVITSQPVPTATFQVGATASLVIEDSSTPVRNKLGLVHGALDMTLAYNSQGFVMTPTAYPAYFFTSVSCNNWSQYSNWYLHIESTTANDFAVILNQHSDGGKPKVLDQVQYSWYQQNGHAYIPLSHFAINVAQVRSIAFAWFRNFNPVTVTKIELTNGVPSDYIGVANRGRAPLITECTNRNQVAFGIDNGDPKLAQRVLRLLDESGIKATIFPLGLTLYDSSNNLTNFHLDAIQRGHEIGLHSWSHPVLSQAPDFQVQQQITDTVKAVKELLGIDAVLFRPPYGAVDARLQHYLFQNNLKTIMWSIDVKDYIFAGTPEFRKQLDAFETDLRNGGSIVVMHFLKADTVELIPEFVAKARQYGKEIVTIGQCLGLS